MVTAAVSKLIHEGAPYRDASTNGTTAFEAAPLTKPPAPRGVSDSGGGSTVELCTNRKRAAASFATSSRYVVRASARNTLSRSNLCALHRARMGPQLSSPSGVRH